MKKESKVILIHQFLVGQLNHWAIWPIMVLLYGLSYIGLQHPNVPPVLFFSYMSFVPFYLYVVRRFSGNLLVFLGLSFLPYGLLFIPKENSYEGFVCFVLCSIYIFTSLARRLRPDDGPGMEREEDRNFLSKEEEKKIVYGRPKKSFNAGFSTKLLDRYMGFYFSLAFLFISLIFMGQSDSMYFSGAVLSALVPYGIVFFIFTYVENFVNFLLVSRGNEGFIPEKQIFIEGIISVGGYSVVCGVILFLYTRFQFLKSFLEGIFYKLWQFIRWINSHIHLDTSVETSGMIDSQSSDGGFGFGMGEVEPSQWSITLFYIAASLIAIGFVILILWSIIRLIGAVKKGFEKKPQVAFDDLDEIVDEREEIREKKSGLTPKIFTAFLSEDERLRQDFKRKAIKISDKPQNVLPSDLNDNSFADKYNKFRYYVR